MLGNREIAAPAAAAEVDSGVGYCLKRMNFHHMQTMATSTDPNAAPGSNSYDSARVLSRGQNRKKSNN
jgi:hypothetical protein